MANFHALGQCWPAFKGGIKVVVSRRPCPRTTREVTRHPGLCRGAAGLSFFITAIVIKSNSWYGLAGERDLERYRQVDE